MEDVRIGRNKVSSASYVAVPSGTTAGLTRILTADLQRTNIMFTCLTADVFIANRNIVVAEGFIMSMTPTTPPVQLRIEDWGDLVTGEWYAYSAGGAGVLLIATSKLLAKQSSELM